MPITAEQQQRRRRWCRAYYRNAKKWRAGPLGYLPPPKFPIRPMDLEFLPCGAKTRRGGQCKKAGLFPSGRCRLHGGRSTGPKRKAEV